MIDYFNIATNIDTQVFFATGIGSGSNASGSWQTWTKPRNASFVFITAIGGGGGGGGAFTSASIRNGGGGGGAAAISKGIFPASLIPDILYVRVGTGGNGSAGANNGVSGATGKLSYVCVQPTSSNLDSDIRNANILLLSGLFFAQAGGNASTGIGGSGGTGGAAASVNALPLFSLGIIQGFTGTDGTAGSIGSAAVNNVIPRNITTGGGGGAGGAALASVDGGSIVSQSISPTIGSRAAGFTALQPSGLVSNKYPMQFTGGGGGNTNTNVGGPGGPGSYGSGGGGGTPDLVSGSNNPGGRGGDGLVIITCF